MIKTGIRMLKVWENQSPKYDGTPSKIKDSNLKMLSIYDKELKHGVDKENEKELKDSSEDKNIRWLNQKLMNILAEKQQKKEFSILILLPIFNYPLFMKENIVEEIIEVKPTKNKNITSEYYSKDRLIIDLEAYQENPVLFGSDKPHIQDERKVKSIISKSILHEILNEEKILLWKYREWLSKRGTLVGLSTFLRCFNESEFPELKTFISKWEYNKKKPEIYIILELLSKKFEKIDLAREFAVECLKNLDNQDILLYLLQLVQGLRYEEDIKTSKLAKFLIERAKYSFILAQNLYWYLCTECDDISVGESYSILLKSYTKQINDSKEFRIISAQVELSKELVKLATECKDKDTLQKRLIDFKISDLYKGSIIKIPISNLEFIDIVPKSSDVFKSANSPICVGFLTQSQEIYRGLFKNGDDLRQDQLIIQIIQVMDKILKENNLDLQLTPYSVMACNSKSGFIECVTPTKSIQKVKDMYKGVESPLEFYFKTFLKGSNDKEKEEEYQEIQNNFIRSCSGYCVISYLLGIGDRHLDNILISPSGKLFHIDFGFILGHEPTHILNKIQRIPPLQITNEMVAVIQGGKGKEGEGYKKFLNYCYSAYNILRKNANLIISLLYLMMDANIDCISKNPNTNAMRSFKDLEKKFLLEKSIEEGCYELQKVIEENQGAGWLRDKIHEYGNMYRDIKGYFF